MASRAFVLVLAALLALCAAAASVAAQQRPLPPQYRIINPGKYKRDQQMTCDDPKDKKPKCLAKCAKRCPDQCIVLCPGCKTFCSTNYSASLYYTCMHHHISF
jgi:hypothetical protein